MPDQGNVDAQKVGEAELPEKYRGKSAAEIAAMHGELETKLGEQGTELGELRQMVRTLMQGRENKPAANEREAADVSEYKRLGDDLILSPEKVLPAVAKKIKDELRAEMRGELTQRDTLRTQTDRFFTDNPNLDQYREIVSYIGNQVFTTHPDWSFDRVLEETKKQSLTYLGSLKERLNSDPGKSKERMKAGITTSGGKAREGIAAGEEEGTPETPTLDPDQQAIMDEIKSVKEFRGPRMGIGRPKPKQS